MLGRTTGLEEEEAPSTPHSASPASSALSDPRQTSELPSVAHSPSPLLDLDSGLRPDHDCPYCHKTFRQPRLLHCLHALCEDCIIALLEGHTISANLDSDFGETQNGAFGSIEDELEPNHTPKSKPPPGVIRCPVCTQDSQIGNDARFAHMLLLDLVRINLMDAAAIQSADMSCESCKAKDKAVARCQDCCNYLCGNCVQAHQFMRCFEGHTVVSFEELRAGGDSGALAHRPIPCTAHPAESFAYFCATCEAAVCKECVIAEHGGHACHRVDEATTGALKAQLRELAAMGDSKAEYCQKLSGELEGGMGELRDRVDAARELLDEEFQRYAAMLEERRVAMQAQLEKLSDLHEDHIRQTSRGLSTTAERLHDACEFAERLLTHGSGMDVLVTRKAVIRQLQNVVHAAPSPNAPTNLHFVSDTAIFARALETYAGSFKSDLIQPGFGGASTPAIDPWKNDINQLIRRISAPPPPAAKPVSILSPNYVDPGLFPYPASNPPPLPQPSQPSFARATPPTSLNLPRPPEQQQQPNMEALAQAIAMMSGQPGPPPGFPLQPPPPSVAPPNYFRRPDSESPFASSAFTQAVGAKAIGSSAVGSGRQSATGGGVLASSSELPLVPPPGFSPFADSGTPFGSSGGLLGSLGCGGPEAGLELGGGGISGAIGGAIGKAPTGKTQPMQIRNKFGSLGQAQSQFNSPHGFCLGPDEEIVVADTNNHRIQVFLKDGTFKFQFGAPGKEEGQLWYPRKVAVIRHPEPRFVVCDRGNERSRMQIFNRNGQFIKKIAIKYVDIVAGLAVDQAKGQIVAVDSVSPTVFRISEAGELLKWFNVSQYMKEPSDIAVSGGEHYICDFKGHSVCVFAEDGSFSRRIGSEKLTSFPNGIDISNQGDVLIGDSHGNRFHVSVFRKDGSFESEFDCPYVKVSRCCGLRITEEGFLVTLAKNNHHVLVLNTLYLP